MPHNFQISLTFKSSLLCAICQGVVPSAGFAYECPFAPCTQIAGVPLEQVAPFAVVVEPRFQFPWLGRTIGSLWVRRALFLPRRLQRGGWEKGTFPGFVIKRFTTETLLGVLPYGSAVKCGRVQGVVKNIEAPAPYSNGFLPKADIEGVDR